MNLAQDLLNAIRGLGVCEGDSVLVSSDMRRIASIAASRKERFGARAFILGLIEILGTEGTLLFPTFNWDFRKGVAFNYRTTPCMTGALGKAALSMEEFTRTRHPIYSFAVWGRDARSLYDMQNMSSFGKESPFSYLHSISKALVIDISLNESITFTHYVEEQVGTPEYRSMKSFTAEYTGPEGVAETKTYTMYMRNLDKIIARTIDPIGVDIDEAGLLNKTLFENIVPISVFMYSDFYNFAERDIKENRARKLCIYKGQED